MAHAQPNGRGNVVVYEHILYQHRIDGDADDDEKALKRQRQQASQVVLSHAAPFLAHHGGHGDGRDAGDKVNLDHSAVLLICFMLVYVAVIGEVLLSSLGGLFG